MKIAIVSDTYFPRINGVSVSTRTFAREFAKLGHTVHIHAPAFPKTKEDNEPFLVVRYPSFVLGFSPEDRMAYGFRKQAKLFIKENYDIVHTQTPFLLGQMALRWSRKSDAKVVHTYHTFYKAYSKYYFWYLPHRLRNYCSDWYSKKYCDSCDLLIAPSPEMAQEILSYRVKTPTKIIPTGIDLSQFENKNPKNFRQKFGFAAEDKLILYVGRLAREKNIDFLLRVFAQIAPKIPEAKFVIAGSGPSLASLAKLALQLKIRNKIVFLGYIKGEMLRDCYSAADLFVFASVTETQGLAVLEALAANVPVVAVNRMGVKNILENEKSGILVEPDEKIFSKAVFKMLTDKKLLAQKRSFTIKTAKKWSSTAMAQRTLEEYQKILSKD